MHFLSSLWGLRLIGKLAVDLLFVLIEHFLLGVTAEALSANIDCKSTSSLQQRQFGPNFQPEPFSCQKIRMNYLSCGTRMWAHVSFVLSQSTRLTDRQTERQTDRKVWAIPCVASLQLHGKNHYIQVLRLTRCSAIAERPRCRVRYSFCQK